ncbi:MAG TPA: hypothetical protein VLF61_01525, partial [Rhabdochlamydiaceae bacterium]|nr:hypothetical protein [Rhabdochlamydiaceae bacterium]
GSQVNNRFLTQSDLVNVLLWEPPNHFTPVTYTIFRNAALTDIAGVVPASTLSFVDHNRRKKQFYTYYLVATNAQGNTMNLGSITVTPIS